MKTQILKLIMLIFGFLLTQNIYAQSLTTTEHKIRDYIAAQQSDALALLEKLVNINSGTANIVGIHQVGEILKKEFVQLGFKTYWVEMPTEMHRAGSLIAEHKGTKGKKILLIGHLDTVFPRESSFQKFERHGNVATGPGVIDMKGGDVAILFALKALKSVHALDDASITVILTGDEEDSGKPTSISRKPLFAVAKDKDVALDFEWSLASNTATIARRGISKWTLETSGKNGHSSEIFQPSSGDGAIFELARILDQMRTELSGEKYLTFNPGIVLGGTTVNFDKNTSEGTAFGKPNVIAATAFANGDLRFLTLKQKKSAQEKMAAIVNQHLPVTKATIKFQDAIPAMPPTQDNQNLLKLYSKVSSDLEYGEVIPLDPGMRGAGDISHIASIVPENLAGLGPVGTGAHSAQETLDVNTLMINTQRAAVLIYRLTH